MTTPRSVLPRAAAIPALVGLLALAACGGQGSVIADNAALSDAARPAMWAGATPDTSPGSARPWLGPTQSGRCCGPGSGVITVASEPPAAPRRAAAPA